MTRAGLILLIVLLSACNSQSESPSKTIAKAMMFSQIDSPVAIPYVDNHILYSSEIKVTHWPFKDMLCIHCNSSVKSYFHPQGIETRVSLRNENSYLFAIESSKPNLHYLSWQFHKTANNTIRACFQRECKNLALFESIQLGTCTLQLTQLIINEAIAGIADSGGIKYQVAAHCF